MSEIGRILVVDDQEANVDMLSRRLQRAGYDVLGASSGQQALDTLDTHSVDLMLLDQMMPGMTGMDVLRVVRSAGSMQNLPIIMVTALNDGAAIAEALDCGANDYISKPLEFQSALARIRAQLARGRAHTRLRKSEERYALASRGSGEGLWDWNLRTNQLYCSPELYTLMGYVSDEALCDPDLWLARVHPSDFASLQRALTAKDTIGRSSLAPGEADEGIHSEFRLRHGDGTYRWISMQGVTVHDASGAPIRRVGSITDITRRMTIDPVTGLGNKRSLLMAVESALQTSADRDEQSPALLVIRLDRFAQFVLSLSHESIETLQREAGRVIEQVVHARIADGAELITTKGIVAHLQEADYAVLVGQKVSSRSAQELASLIVTALTRILHVQGIDIQLSASAGIAMLGPDHIDCTEALRDAIAAVGAAETRTGVRTVLFDGAMRAIRDNRLRLSSDLRSALRRGEFEVYYEPRVDLRDGRICGFEALIRWHHPDQGLIAPGDFIPLAEENGLIHDIGLWVLEQSCRQTRAWMEELSLGEEFEIAVNLSAAQCWEPDLVERVEAILAAAGLPARLLKLELTESVFLHDLVKARSVMAALKELGVALKIDDFGTGYSCLQYLCELPFDSLKIDRSFVMNLRSAGSEAFQVVRSIVDMAERLKMDVIAEGIEEREQLVLMRQMGCNFGQGYFFSRPVTSTLAGAMLRARTLPL